MRRGIILFPALAAIALLWSGCSKPSSPDAQAMLSEMVTAGSRNSFSGIKTVEQKSGNQFFRFRMKIDHLAPDSTRMEFLEPEAKRGQIVVKRGSCSWRWGQEDRQPTHFKPRGSFRNMDIRNMALLMENYQVEHMGSEQVAERLADVLRILSRNDPGVQRLIWLDRASRMPLKSEETLRNEHGRHDARFVYEQIEFRSDLPPELFDVPLKEGSRSWLSPRERKSITLEEAKRLAPFKPVLPQSLPAGFVLECVRWVERPPAGFLHFHYSDGLRAVSLFEESSETFHPANMQWAESSGDKDKVYRMQEGATTILHRHRNGMHATLVGDISGEALIRMISSLES